MGTNFYLRGWEYDEETQQYTELRRYSSGVPSGEAGYHIGKRSAAGLFCWDCNEPLTIGGKDAIHRSASGTRSSCEKCGKKPEERPSLTTGAAGVELGFAKPKATRPTGVSSCASFTWAQPEEVFTAFVSDHLDHAIVIDEYGRINVGPGIRDDAGVQLPRAVSRHDRAVFLVSKSVRKKADRTGQLEIFPTPSWPGSVVRGAQ